MLLDLYVMRKGFEELLTINAEPGTVPPARYPYPFLFSRFTLSIYKRNNKRLCSGERSRFDVNNDGDDDQI